MSINAGNGVSYTLDLLINGTAINPPFEQQYYAGGSGSATIVLPGSFLMGLTVGQTIQINMTNTTGQLSAFDAYFPSICILRVADLPPI